MYDYILEESIIKKELDKRVNKEINNNSFLCQFEKLINEFKENIINQEYENLLQKFIVFEIKKIIPSYFELESTPYIDKIYDYELREEKTILKIPLIKKEGNFKDKNKIYLYFLISFDLTEDELYEVLIIFEYNNERFFEYRINQNGFF